MPLQERMTSSPGASARSVLVSLCTGVLIAGTLLAEERRATLDEGAVAVMGDTGDPWVEARPRRGEGANAFARRMCGSSRDWARIAEANGRHTKPRLDTRYRVSFECLTDAHRAAALRALFPGDRSDVRGWIHRVETSGEVQRGLWRLAQWFTGSGESFRAVREANGLVDEELQIGQEVLIPVAILRPALRASVLAAARQAPQLSFGRDAQGEYASYRLRAGEALYSSVVVRFTGEVFASDVNRLAGEIAQRSAIADVTDIPVGYEVKVPVELLLPEFLPADDPRRRDFEASRSVASRYTNKLRALDLEGVTVILDAGHGGRDVGASMGSVWESVYVYDIAVRVRELIEANTAAQVLMTTRDGSRWSINNRDVLPASRGHAVLTTPPYAIEVGKVSTNLRYYLANSYLRDALAREPETGKVIFLSIHADSLHPSVRGAMVYVPGVVGTASRGKSEPVYASRAEVKEQPSFTISDRDRERHKGLSLDLADNIIAGFRSHRLAVHPNLPVRDRIIRRRGRPWVPAVLRYNQVPAKVLLEVGNLANAEDRRLVQTRAHRDRVAEAIVDGVLGYYGLEPLARSGGESQLASTAQGAP